MTSPALHALIGTTTRPCTLHRYPAAVLCAECRKGAGELLEGYNRQLAGEFAVAMVETSKTDPEVAEALADVRARARAAVERRDTKE